MKAHRKEPSDDFLAECGVTSHLPPSHTQSAMDAIEDVYALVEPYRIEFPGFDKALTRLNDARIHLVQIGAKAKP